MGGHEINAKWPGEIDAFFKNPALCHVPGGENFTAVAVRVEPFFKRCLAEMDDKDIAIVSHGGIIRVLLCLFLGVDLNNIWNFSVGNCSTSTLAKWRGFQRLQNGAGSRQCWKTPTQPIIYVKFWLTNVKNSHDILTFVL